MMVIPLYKNRLAQFPEASKGRDLSDHRLQQRTEELTVSQPHSLPGPRCRCPRRNSPLFGGKKKSQCLPVSADIELTQALAEPISWSRCVTHNKDHATIIENLTYRPSSKSCLSTNPRSRSAGQTLTISDTSLWQRTGQLPVEHEDELQKKKKMGLDWTYARFANLHPAPPDKL